jgi:hypothetical protein
VSTEVTTRSKKWVELRLLSLVCAHVRIRYRDADWLRSSAVKVTKCLSMQDWSFIASHIAAESHLLKLQRLQNKVLRTIGNFPRRTSVRDMYVAFQIPYVY